MNDTTSTTETTEQPRKACCGRKKSFCLFALLVVFIGTLAFVYFCPLFEPRHTTVEVAGQSEVLRAQIESLGHRVDALESRVESLAAAAAKSPSTAASAPEEAKTDTATAAGLARVQSDMVALSSAMVSLQDQVKATGTTAAEARENAASLIASVVAFIQLREAAASGRPFANELASMRDVSKNDATVQAASTMLEPYAVTGAPTLAVLRDALLEREPSVAVAVAKGAAQNWWQRIVAELKSLVIVRPVHGGEGDALAQLEGSLTKGGAAAAMESFKALPADAQRTLADWQSQLEARQHVDEGVAMIATRFITLPAVKTP